MGKGVLSRNDEKLDIYMQRLDSNTMYIKINAKWITDQNVRVKAMKLLQENEWGQLHGFV